MSTGKKYQSPTTYDVPKEFFVEEIGEVKSKIVYEVIKRAFDIVASLIGLIVTMPIMLIIAILIKAIDGGSVLYFQERLGLGGEPFTIVKFRTMNEDAEADGPKWSDGEFDERITSVGMFLRSVRLDELPQLWCILNGSMTFVGPRPEREYFYNEFDKYIHGFRQRMYVKQGLTGHAQVNGGYFLLPEEKIKFDIEYIKNRSLLFDLKIILKTIITVLTGKGAK